MPFPGEIRLYADWLEIAFAWLKNEEEIAEREAIFEAERVKAAAEIAKKQGCPATLTRPAPMSGVKRVKRGGAGAQAQRGATALLMRARGGSPSIF